MILVENDSMVGLNNLVATKTTNRDSDCDEKRANSNEKAMQYFMEMVEWFEKADLDFLKNLYNMEKAVYEKGLKDSSAFLGFLEDYLKKSDKI